MRAIRNYVWMALMSASLVTASAASAQTSRSQNTSTHRTTTGSAASTASTSRSSRTVNSTTKQSAVRPGGSAISTRPASTQTNSNKRPTGTTTTQRPGNGNINPGNQRPTGNPGNQRPGTSTPRPGNSNPRPGSSTTVRPGGTTSTIRPGGATSAPRPGSGGSPASRPTPLPSYRPPVAYRWERPLPPAPPRYNYVRVGVPTIGSVLGVAFGSIIDAGIASLINNGYTVSSVYGNNTIYLSNVSQYGVTWPEATIYYTNGGMSGARFQYGSYSPTDYRFMTAYSQLCATYGNPVSYVENGGWPVATWWGGNNTGYITLQYGPGTTDTGAMMYYTDLIYGQ